MTNNTFNLNEKVAFVTGGNRGLGLGMAEGLANAGANIVIAARDEKKNADAIEKISANGGLAIGVRCDVADPVSVKSAFAQVVKQLGRVDIVVNNSGTSCRFRPEDTPDEEWDRVMDVNLKGPFMVAREAYPYFLASGGGKLINIASMMSIFGGEYDTAYAPSKGGIVQFTKVCAIAWAKDNIQVNSILPGWLYTDLTQSYLKKFPDQEKLIRERTPAGRWGEPGDLAGPVVFLASSASDFVTGASLIVDGGYSIK
ncbi:glucose 1-dehydrogenase [Pseudohalocynthiibacter sp. F2068]|uniref:SDR family NAD(P)-dependent oxidoreductase n=1 Tax=Pseudohalocynthiibacter sp. F2068 TaxID=2926418 RepID=UPI001FF602B5|nr:glucose 1-dehydrogenase [Pseudohalocynthiibacter sp. F2068]MCK0104423.1 glucose 1-dehydrogenase [Pseudohalocynthiibacter sp. F2068]